MKNMKTFAFIALTLLISCSFAIKSRSNSGLKKQAPRKTTTAPVTTTNTTAPANNSTTPVNGTATNGTPVNGTATNGTATNGTASPKNITARTDNTMKNKTIFDRALRKGKEVLDIFGNESNSSAFTKFSYFAMFALSAMIL